MQVIALDALIQSYFGPHWRPIYPYIKTSSLPVVSAAGGSLNLPAKTDVITDNLPAGTGLIITDLFVDHVDDIGSDFLQWQISQGGIPINGLESLGGSIGAVKSFIEVLGLVSPGMSYALSVLNYAGTEAVPTNYPATQATRVAAIVKGYLISKSFRGF